MEALIAVFVIVGAILFLGWAWWSYRREADADMHMRLAEHCRNIATRFEPDSEGYKAFIKKARYHAKKAGFH